MVIRAAHLQGAQQFFWGNFLLDEKSSLFFRLKYFSQVNYLIELGLIDIWFIIVWSGVIRQNLPRSGLFPRLTKKRTKLAAPVYTVVLFEWDIQVITWTIVETEWLLYFHLNNFFFYICFSRITRFYRAEVGNVSNNTEIKCLTSFLVKNYWKYMFFRVCIQLFSAHFSHRFVECSTQLKHIFTCRDELQHFDGECSLFCRSAFRMCFRNLKFTPR